MHQTSPPYLTQDKEIYFFAVTRHIRKFFVFLPIQIFFPTIELIFPPSFPSAGGLHLLRGTPLHRLRCAHDHRDRRRRRPLLPIREGPSLSNAFISFSPLGFLGVRSGVYRCDRFHIQRPFSCHSSGPLAAYALRRNRSHRLHSGESEPS